MISRPLVSTAFYDALTVWGWAALILVLYAVHLVEKWIRARRADKQLQAELEMRAGMREARRRGWIPEDLQ